MIIAVGFGIIVLIVLAAIVRGLYIIAQELKYLRITLDAHYSELSDKMNQFSLEIVLMREVITKKLQKKGDIC